jgi:glycosyltransferase involved in cell wall biosynthesis
MFDLPKRRTAVVAPVYNEPGTWRDICSKLRSYFDLVVVVDDGSDVPLEDPGWEGIELIHHAENRGKGMALETGFRRCLGWGADSIGTIDTDGEHDPRNFRDILMRNSRHDLINLSRAEFFGGYSFFRRTRNSVFSRILSRKLGHRILDTQSGMRLFSARAVQACLWHGLPKGYAVETAMLEIVASENLRLSEVPMTYEGAVRNGKKYRNLSVLTADLRAFSSRLMPHSDEANGVKKSGDAAARRTLKQ